MQWNQLLDWPRYPSLFIEQSTVIDVLVQPFIYLGRPRRLRGSPRVEAVYFSPNT